MLSLTDPLGRNITLDHPPSRIVSLVPSQTELLAYLGLDEAVVGITKFCVHPSHWFRHKTRIGGTKNIHFEQVQKLSPHLILANREENVKDQVEALAAHYPTYVSDVNTLEEALLMIGQVGLLTGKNEEAQTLTNEIKRAFGTLLPQVPRLKAAYLIWQDPVMTVGGDTFIHNMLLHAGFQNVFGHLTRYPVVSVDHIRDAAPDVVLLSSEPYPFKEKHVVQWQAQLSDTKVRLVDGELFSWYGSRLLQAPSYFRDLAQQLSFAK